MVFRSHRDLEVWKRAMDLAVEVYRQTARFPTDERYGLKGQMRRAAVSVPSNIAEGAARGTRRDFERFLRMALGSLAELETQWLLAQGLALVPQEEDGILRRIKQIRVMILGLIRNLRQTK